MTPNLKIPTGLPAELSKLSKLPGQNCPSHPYNYRDCHGDVWDIEGAPQVLRGEKVFKIFWGRSQAQIWDQNTIQSVYGGLARAPQVVHFV